MTIKPSQLVAAGLVSGFLLIGGVSLASAQEAPTTTETTPSTVAPETPTAPSEDPAQTAPAPSADDPNCPNMGEGSGTGAATATGAHARGPRSGPRSGATTPTVDASAV